MENKHIVIGGAIVLAVLFILFFILPKNEEPVLQDDPLNFNLDNPPQNQQTPNVTQLQGEDIKPGSGSAVVAAGDTIIVHYKGTFLDGQVFDSSYDRGQPFSVTIGAGQVIPGFDRGVIGMKVGGQRRLLIPADLAYGAQGQGAIPPNTPIAFEIELLELNKPQSPTPTPEEPQDDNSEENNQGENSEETPTPEPE